MLTLTRKINEAVILETKPCCCGNCSDEATMIKVVVTRIGDVQVQLGFDAPRTVTIDREEIYEAKQAGDMK